MAAPTPRTTVKRIPDRARYDRAAVEAILDEAYLCHLALVDPDGRPFVIPTIHARVDDVLYLHGSPASRALRTAAADGVECSVAVTILDGLVLSRSAFHHSMNYRSVVVYGRASRVDAEGEKRAALDALVEHVVHGRTAPGHTRAPSDKELKGTLVLRLPLDEASAKVRTGGAVEDPDDLGAGLDPAVWAGVVPLHVVPGEPVADPEVSAPWPGYDLTR